MTLSPQNVTAAPMGDAAVSGPFGGDVKSRHRDRWASLAVSGVLTAMTVALIAPTVRYARNVPLAEDWNLVSVLAGDEPNFWSWVWSQNNVTAGLAAAFVLAPRQIRGRTAVVDAFFPLLLLHLGNWETSCGAGRCSSSS